MVGWGWIEIHNAQAGEYAGRPPNFGHDVLIAQDLPLGSGRCKPFLQPIELSRTDHGSADIRARGEPSDVGLVVCHRHCSAIVCILLNASFYAGVEHVKRQNIGKIKASIDLKAIGNIQWIISIGEPLMVGLCCVIFPGVPVALRFRIVVFCARHEGIVGKLVVIPHRDPGHGGMKDLQIGVASVLRITSSVIINADNVIGRQGNPAHGCGRGFVEHIGIAVFAGIGPVFVDVVAKMNGKLCVRLGRFCIGIEKPSRIK